MPSNSERDRRTVLARHKVLKEVQGGINGWDYVETPSLTCMLRWSISDRTQPTEPSPPHTKTRNGLKCRNRCNLQIRDCLHTAIKAHY